MSEDFDLRSREYWLRMFWGLFLGLISAMGAFIFIGLMNAGQSLILPDLTDWTPFSGSWLMVVIMTSIGFLVGLVHHYSSATELDVFEAVDEGRMDPKPVPSSLLASLLSLIGGFSLGPEVPTGMLSAGLGTWISDRRKMDTGTTRTNVLSSVSSAYSGLFSSPFAVLLMLFESRHQQNLVYYGTLLIAAISGVIGFSLFYWLGGDSFSLLLDLLAPPSYDLRIWHLAAAVLLGILAVPFGLLFPIMNKILSRLVMPLNGQPILRSTVGGLLLGLLSVALPTTVGLGTNEMVTVTQQAAEIGVFLLIIFALAKLLALSGALSFGFIGGPIFPLLFVGSSVGSAIHLIFPQLPLGLALGCMIVAVPASIVPIPVSLAVIGIVIIGISLTNALPVLVAALVAFSVTHGLLIKKEEKTESSFPTQE
ncbi:MAG: Cl-channel voltage-gated family protein [Methanolobus sp. T82-4]|nr:MAG: Cl-channel voltage-gated family protein [Methanolobus sp. T82-4]